LVSLGCRWSKQGRLKVDIPMENDLGSEMLTRDRLKSSARSSDKPLIPEVFGQMVSSKMDFRDELVFEENPPSVRVWMWVWVLGATGGSRAYKAGSLGKTSGRQLEGTALNFLKAHSISTSLGYCQDVHCQKHEQISDEPYRFVRKKVVPRQRTRPGLLIPGSHY